MNQRDFVGFSFNGVHSSDLGILRVSDGDRYTEELYPEIEDRRNAVVGRDGEYYYGSDYRSKTFTVQIAFDHVTEKQFRQIVYLFSTKKPSSLIFDERPYKEYKVKIGSPISLNYICFDEEKRVASVEPQDGVRIVDRKYNVTEVTVVSKPETLEVTIDKELFLQSYSGEGDYDFIYQNETWIYDGQDVNLEEIGVTITGTSTENDEITIQVKVVPIEIEREQVYPWIYTGEKERIYKGEGEIEFICSTPMARAPFKTIEQYIVTDSINGNVITTYDNTDEWEDASGILRADDYSGENLDAIVPMGGGEGFKYKTYNPGDIDTPFYLYIPFPESGEITGENDKVIVHLPTGTMVFDTIVKKGNDTGILINTSNHLVEGVEYVLEDASRNLNAWPTTGNLYNDYLVRGDFPKILHHGPIERITNLNNRFQELIVGCTIVYTDVNENSGETIDMNGDTGVDLNKVRLFYDYWYY